MTAYPAKTLVVDVLIEVARRSVIENTARHPEDIEIAMTSAMEAAAKTLTVLTEKGALVT